MSRTARNLNELAKMLELEAKKAMQREDSNVKQTAIKAGRDRVESDVYDVYTPDPNNPDSYQRTFELRESWEVKSTKDGISIENTRADGDRDVAYIVHSGEGYQYDFPYAGVPRPFIENTREDLRNSNKLSNALKKDLKDIGINIK